jgi:hypothetical protein
MIVRDGCGDEDERERDGENLVINIIRLFMAITGILCLCTCFHLYGTYV